MIQYENIQKAMKMDIAVSRDMANAIYRWSNIYTNKASWLNEDVKSLNLAAAICSEMARLVTIESKIEISGSARADFIKKSMKKFFFKFPNYVEYCCACGGVVFKPYVFDNKIMIDVVRAGYFYPVAFNGAEEITEVIFPEFKRVGKKLYTRLEYQGLVGNKYIIQNKAFVSTKSHVKTDNIINLGQEIPLETVKEWEDIAPYIEFENADCTLFSYMKVPAANNIDLDSPLGVSIFARSENFIKDADEQYGAILWEYRSKETAIQAADEFFKKDRNGNPILPKGKEKIYHAMGDVSGKDNQPFFNAYSPEIRDESFFNGFNKILQRIEFNSGLAYGTLSDPQVVDKTAEEIRSSKQRSYDTVKAFQNGAGDSIELLVRAIDAWITIMDLAPGGVVHTSCDWDDSLVVDKKYENEQNRADVSMGAMGLVEYRMRRFGETEDQAKKMIPDYQEEVQE